MSKIMRFEDFITEGKTKDKECEEKDKECKDKECKDKEECTDKKDKECKDKEDKKECKDKEECDKPKGDYKALQKKLLAKYDTKSPFSLEPAERKKYFAELKKCWEKGVGLTKCGEDLMK